ncbi:Hypothetical predicted protein [Paramuricea clavata]|uniref:Uncharacterized protein n=1 Tax=Paramuricea clavata TaxID=317549 RepID=A0A7D9LB78_PARCT|nr:Hypothetical predicted protein [Paramuricea clavata]
MKEVMAQVICSVGVILQLRDDFTGHQEDELFNEAVHFTEELIIDVQPRDQTNYALLLHSTMKHIQHEENSTSDDQFNGNGNKVSMIEVISGNCCRTERTHRSVDSIN